MKEDPHEDEQSHNHGTEGIDEDVIEASQSYYTSSAKVTESKQPVDPTSSSSEDQEIFQSGLSIDW